MVNLCRHKDPPPPMETIQEVTSVFCFFKKTRYYYVYIFIYVYFKIYIFLPL